MNHLTDASAAGPGEGHALVIGGSLAGLLAARVLADHFDRVTIVERDDYPPGPAPRRGVPQARHVHALMRRGQLLLDELFPGLPGQLVAAGALVLDSAREMAMLTPAGWAVRFPSDLSMLACTRDLIDWYVRRRLKLFPQISFREGGTVTRLLPQTSGRRVAGAVVRFGDQSGEGEEQTILADLVVDASGRGSRAPQWLKELGCAPPVETTVNAFLGYASRLYRPAADFDPGWKSLYIQPAPPGRKRGCLIFPVEGGRWLATMWGGGRDYPPTDDAGFLEFARSLPGSHAYDALRAAEPLSAVSVTHSTENRLRHYERLARQPDNFLVTGDAVCAFNPVYGQGMTVAALGAQTLAGLLREAGGRQTSGFARRFQRRLADINRGPWGLATSSDYRYREVAAAPPGLSTRLMHRYLDEIIQLSTERPEVRRVLMEVFHMLRPPTALFGPGVVRHVVARLGVKRTSPPGVAMPTTA
ncbi:MAG: NAD(P)/FAD-dependent oxidoreductase [Pyrinomonadaceae bacterium]